MTNKRRFVTAHKARYAVSTLCRVPAISRGWFYGFLASQPARDQRQADRDARDPELLPGIRTFFKAGRKCYGSKRIHQDPVADGETVSERRVARIMKENKVSPHLNKRRKPVTTDSNHKMSPSPNLLEQAFHCLTPDTVRLADITCIDTDEGWLCPAGVKDMATREIVGWAMEDHMRAGLCCDALTMAPGRRGPVPGLIHHSDRGSRYAGGEYRKLIEKAGLTQSMSRKGECLDNAPMESFPASLKKELVHRRRFKTRAEARAAILEYIEVFYNRQRRHSAIGYKTPKQAFEDMTWKWPHRVNNQTVRKQGRSPVRLQLHALACNPATFLRCINLPGEMADRSLTGLQLKLIRIGARVVRHARAITFQLAGIAVTGPMVRAVPAAIHRLRAPPICA